MSLYSKKKREMKMKRKRAGRNRFKQSRKVKLGNLVSTQNPGIGFPIIPF